MSTNLTEQPTSQAFDFGQIGEVQGEAAVTAREGEERKGQPISSICLETLSI